MSAKDNVVTVGGEPRIDFLPPEIKQKKQARRSLRSLILLVVLVLALGIVAYTGVTTLAIAAQLNLSSEQDRTRELLSAQNQYSEAKNAAATVETAKDALLVASATEVQWKEYIGLVASTLPAGTVVGAIVVDGQSATELPQVSSDEIIPMGNSSVSVTGTFISLNEIANWLDAIETLPGYLGAMVGESTLSPEGGYEITVDIRLGPEAFENHVTDGADGAEAGSDDDDAAAGE